MIAFTFPVLLRCMQVYMVVLLSSIDRGFEGLLNFMPWMIHVCLADITG